MGCGEMDERIPSKLCGRPFGEADLERIRREIVAADPPQRSEIARRVCRALDWADVLGRPKLMSARVGLLRLHRAGLIALPPPSGGNGNGRGLVQAPESWPEPAPVAGTVGALHGLRLEAVLEPHASRLWNGLIARYHDLGYTPLPGAQLRYLIHHDGGVPGAIGFGAAAWKVAARDRWIGWDAPCREARLEAARVAEDFPARYGEPVVLLETYVQLPRFAGTCYRAANWRYVGVTAGRGKCDRTHCAALPRKAVDVYPLTADFRAALGVRA